MKTLPLLLKHPLLFIFGCFFTSFLAILLLGVFALLLTSITGLKPELLGRVIAGVVVVGFFPLGIAFVKFVVEKSYRNWKIFNK